MVDRDKVQGLLERLRRYTNYLQDIAQTEHDAFVSDPHAIGSARYYLQVSIETCIAIGNHIIAAEQLRTPRDYKDIFRVLDEAGVLSGELSMTMRELAGLRNMLVHVYAEVDDGLLFSGIRTDLADFDAFAREVCAFLTRANCEGTSSQVAPPTDEPR